MTYRPWFEVNPEIFQIEREAMEACGFALDSAALSTKKKVEFQGYSRVDPSRPLTVRYPNEFPSLPPSVYSNTPDRYLSQHHQRFTGEICTFGQRRAQWDAGRLGTDAVDEAEEIIRKYPPGSQTQDDNVPEPVTAELPFDRHNSLLLPGEIVEKIGTPSSKRVGRVDILLRSTAEKVGNEEYRRGVIIGIRVDGNEVVAPDRYKRWPFNSTESTGGVLVLLPSPPSIPRDFPDLRDWVAGFHFGKARGWTIFLYPDQSIERTREQLQGFCVYVASKTELRIVKIHQLIGANRSARVPDLEALGEKKILLIGCGALGSKTAVALAASGARNFRLIDGAHMGPGNAVRHEVGAEAFGLPKAYALLRRIHDVNPDAIGLSDWYLQIIGDVNEPTESDERLLDLVREADLVIEATGKHGVSRYINSLCQHFRVPGLFVSVTNGAWSGEVIRTVPGETACWLCWKHQYYDTRPPGEPPPPQGVFAPGCDQPTFTGTTYEVGVVANLASWVAVETLLSRKSGRRSILGDYIRWIGRDEGSKVEFRTEVLPISKRETCRLCRG